MGKGSNHLAAGLAAALALPCGAFALGLPFPVALGLAALLYAAVALLLAPRRAADRIAPGTATRAQAELVAGLVEEGEAAVARLRASARLLKSKPAAATTAHLAEVGRGILDRLAAEPAKLPAVRRFLTYYLPRSADLAEGLAVVEGQRAPDGRRQAEVEATLARLDGAFTYYADGFARGELDALDTELKLLGRALAEDLGPASAGKGEV